MTYNTYIPLAKVPSLLRNFVAWRIGAERSTLDSTPSSMGLNLENSPQPLGLRCILRLWPGTQEERDFTLVDFQFRARQWYLEKWLLSALNSGRFFKTPDSTGSRITRQLMRTRLGMKG